MEGNSHKSRHERREDRDEMEESPRREYRDREKERRKEKEHKSRDKEREREKETSSRDKRKEDRDDRVRDKDYDRDKHREKERERDREKDHRRDRERDKDGGMEKESERSREKERGKEKTKERERESDRDKERDRVKEKEREKVSDRDREKSKEKTKEKEREVDKEKERSKDRVSKKSHEEESQERTKDGGKHDYDGKDRDDGERNVEGSGGVSTSVLEGRLAKMREERFLKKSEVASEVLAWVSKSRKLEEKRNVEKEKALRRSKVFEEQDNLVQDGGEDDETDHHAAHDLAGVKVLHGLDEVVEGGAVVLTLKDQSVLANGDINNDVDLLENVEIGEQKRRDEAYRAAKKNTGLYDDKFSGEPGAEKKILPQYDEPTDDGGVTLDAKGRFSSEAEKKIEELRRRLQGQTNSNHFEDLSSSVKVASDYYTQEEMLRFKKPKKKKALRKKEKLDIDALEAEARAAGLGAEDLGSRRDGRRQAMREEQERSEAEKRSNAYQSAIAKAEEASQSLRMEQVLPIKVDEDENTVFADDEEDLHKALERARKLALKKQSEVPSGPEAIAHLATSAASQTVDNKDSTTAEAQENKVVFTEMEEFVWGLQLDEDVRKPGGQDVFMDEDEAPRTSDQEMTDDAGGWAEVKDISKDEDMSSEPKEEIRPDETIHEVAVGKGLSGALKLLKERGALKETIEWGGRNMDKKKSKLVGIVDNDENAERFKDIRIERTDEFGRTLTPKEAFRSLSHKFHGKGPGKMKQEKRMKQYLEELKLKQMKNSDTPSLSVERMREAQAQLKAPYLVLSGHVKPGQTSDPQSGFATVEKDASGGLTPMLGDRKVEHFLGIKRKAEPGNSSAPKKPKP